jgi:hypothetical protein
LGHEIVLVGCLPEPEPHPGLLLLEPLLGTLHVELPALLGELLFLVLELVVELGVLAGHVPTHAGLGLVEVGLGKVRCPSISVLAAGVELLLAT